MFIGHCWKGILFEQVDENTPFPFLPPALGEMMENIFVRLGAFRKYWFDCWSNSVLFCVMGAYIVGVGAKNNSLSTSLRLVLNQVVKFSCKMQLRGHLQVMLYRRLRERNQIPVIERVYFRIILTFLPVRMIVL